MKNVFHCHFVKTLVMF